MTEQMDKSRKRERIAEATDLPSCMLGNAPDIDAAFIEKLEGDAGIFLFLFMFMFWVCCDC